jgi:acyl-CoA synthetase (AMP-forming)/AMP-acid ligase II
MSEEVEITESSIIPQVLKERIELHPDRLAQIDGDEKMTYGEFGDRMYRLASGLIDLGVQPGEMVAIVLPSCNTFPVAMYGAIQMGAVSVGINPILKPNEFKHIFSDSEAVAVIVAEKIPGVDPLGIIREMRSSLPNLRHVIVDGKAEGTEINLEELLAKSEVKDTFHQAEPDDLAALVYTSGTTGLPKGSMHSHYTLLYPLISDTLDPPDLKQLITMIWRYGYGYFKRLIQYRDIPVRLYVSPPPYTGGGALMVIQSFMRGRVLVHKDRFVPSEVLAMIEKDEVNVMVLPPVLAKLLAQHPDVDKYDLSSLIYISLGASPVPPSLVDEMLDRIGCPVMIGYGVTELVGGPARTNPFADSRKNLRETIGKTVTGFDIKVVDENRQPVPVGEVGELALRGAPKALGYYKAEQLTKSSFDENGWYYSGDLGTMDKDGYVRIAGRIKDMIIRGGQNIYPAEIENVLIKHPKIKQASVIGIPDAIAGEKVLAYIIPEGDFELSQVEVLNYCRENMAAYRVPGNVFFVDEFPLNASGKVLKRVLREEALKNGV